jgi:hypothetical protein
VSFAIGQRMLDLARPLIEGPSSPGTLYYRVVSSGHHWLRGDWSVEHEIEESALEDGLRKGLLFEVITYRGVHAEKRLRRGEFAAARAEIALLRTISEEFEQQMAREYCLGMPCRRQGGRPPAGGAACLRLSRVAPRAPRARPQFVAAQSRDLRAARNAARVGAHPA